MLANNFINADILSIISQYIAHVVDNTNISLNVWENMLLGKDDYEYKAYSPYSGFFSYCRLQQYFLWNKLYTKM